MSPSPSSLYGERGIADISQGRRSPLSRGRPGDQWWQSISMKTSWEREKTKKTLARKKGWEKEREGRRGMHTKMCRLLPQGKERRTFLRNILLSAAWNTPFEWTGRPSDHVSQASTNVQIENAKRFFQLYCHVLFAFLSCRVHDCVFI